ncbi:Wadjet anti-phage system protein JetD domain-containing protein [Shewanella algae]|uniref:Wadjet anti-phage system protein JetD domain-containing protein n=1 Tax=Shewanella algae TaxID=38313 RepID=UPI0034D4A2E5
MPETKRRPAWGLLQQDAVEVLRTKYWNNTKTLKSLLIGNTGFPIQISLKPPKGNAALNNISHFQEFVDSWKSFCEQPGYESIQVNVRWERVMFRSISEQQVPTYLTIPDISSLGRMLGDVEEQQLKDWHSRIASIFDSLSTELAKRIVYPIRSTYERELFSTLIANLEILSGFSKLELELLVKLIPQLHKGMGRGSYLRALPVIFVDTKFVEKNLKLIESVTAAIIDCSAKEMGLLSWLDCRDKPKDWLLVKPLCKNAADALGGLPLLRMSSETLLNFELPAKNILVIENEQSCLSLDSIPDTIAVSGGGKNVSWMRANWLAKKRVGYWGDVDSDGLSILSDVRSKLSTIIPLMMDSETIETYRERMVAEHECTVKDPVGLTVAELALFRALRNGDYVYKRLEQERLPLDYVHKILRLWCSS